MNAFELRELARKHLRGTPRSLARSAWQALEGVRPARLQRQWRHGRLNRQTATDEIVVREGIKLRIDPRSREAFEWFCFRSVEMARELDGFIEDTRSCRWLVDVGACHGIFSLVFTKGRPAARALAVDPSPLAQEVLQANLCLNGDADVTPLTLALGDGEGELRMRLNWHHLEAVPEVAAAEGDVRVPVRTLDAVCAEAGFVPDAIKIDVEGFETAVLRGGESVLRRARPLLFLEVHPARLRELGSSTAEALGFLQGLGYVFVAAEGGAATVRELAARDAVFRVRCRPR
jgi:FkbM family methyltransferase